MADAVASVDKELVAKSYGIDPEGEPDAFQFLSRMLNFPLPEPWTQHTDKKGRSFYWNPASRRSAWAHPLASTHKSLIHAFRRIKEAGLVGDDRKALVLAEIEEFHRQGEQEIGLWRVSHAPDGTAYYYKAGTQETRWDNPRDELQRHQELRVRMLSELLEADIESPDSLDVTRNPEEAPRAHAACPNCAAINAFEPSDAAKTMITCGSCGHTFEVLNERHRLEASSGAYPSTASKQQIEPKRLQREFDAVAVSPDPASGGKTSQPSSMPSATLDEANPRRRLAESGQKSLYDGTDVAWVLPDELAINLGLRLDDETDKASFHILKPLFTVPTGALAGLPTADWTH
jgi:hypothetical protein